MVALGLAGLVRRIPERLFLVATLALGVLVIAAGYGGALGGPVAEPVQHLLSGQLAILRNVSKFSPDVALPLALGFASMVSSPLQLRRRARERADAGLGVRGARLDGPNASSPSSSPAAVVARRDTVLEPRALPAGLVHRHPRRTGPRPPTGSARTRTMAPRCWLPARPSASTPGDGRSTSPSTVLTETSWSVRSLVPVGSNGNDQILDTVEASLDSGVAAPGMAQFLARSGYDDVVVRNDLDLAATKAPAPAQVRQVLSQTAGLKLVASFGPVISQTAGESHRHARL